jgi:hypothetical protein
MQGDIKEIEIKSSPQTLEGKVKSAAHKATQKFAEVLDKVIQQDPDKP